jgi:F0F1-type ATP synthase membrane subunit b/b'
MRRIRWTLMALGVIALGARWVAKPQAAVGAAAPATPQAAKDHWSFKPPVRPGVPSVKNASWVRNPIDAFVASEHEKRGLTARPEAAKNVLLRRVYLDLTGLPPTREQLHAFLADPAPDAYEKVVDQLLASPRYGERWGRHWMDVWRYSDWAGYQAEVRESQPHIWRWRDWIIESLNADKPYDQMVREMLAADELSPGDPDALRATGFLARNWYKFNRNVWLENTVEHTSKAFLGLTLNCAKCHDHKYDPVTQKEHYAFRAFFEPYNVRTDRVPGEPDTAKNGLVRVFDADASTKTFLFFRGDEKNPDESEPLAPATPAVLGKGVEVKPVVLPVGSYFPGRQDWLRKEVIEAAAKGEADAAAAVAKADLGVTEAQKKLDGAGASDFTEARAALEKAQAAATLARVRLVAARAERSSTEARLAADAARYADAPSAPPAASPDGPFASASRAERDAAVFQLEADVVAAEQSLATGKKDEADKKLAEARKKLAEAKEKAKQPGTDYTSITRAYPKTSTGRRLALAKWITSPENPLAARVAVNHLWMRHFGEGLVPTVFDFGLNGKPPTNPALLDWLAVELVDPSTAPGRGRGWSMKAIHRLIVTSATYRMESSDPGTSDPSHRTDPDNHHLWRAPSRRMDAEVVRDSVLFAAGKLDLATGGPDLDPEKGLTLARRSVYFRHAPEKQMTFLRLFDAANPAECYRRQPSIMPQQALALANSPLAWSQARVLAATLAKSSGDAFVAAAFEQLLTRPPTQAERSTCEAFLKQQAERLKDPAKLEAFTAGEAPAVAPSADPEQRARESLVHVLLNHNDFVTIR